jgi:hypothetical protein
MSNGRMAEIDGKDDIGSGRGLFEDSIQNVLKGIEESRQTP